jgi:transposase
MKEHLFVTVWLGQQRFAPAYCLQRCLTAVTTKELSLRSVSKQFNIPRATIQKRLKQGKTSAASNLGCYKRVLSEDMENQLKQRVLEMEGLFYVMTTTDLRHISL